MKIIIITSLWVCLFSLTGLAQDTVYRPRFLVNNQLIPYAVKLQTDVPVSNSHLATPENNECIKTGTLMFDSYLLPAVATNKNLVIFGVGYMSDWFSENNLNINNYYHGAYLNLFATGSVSEKWFWLTYQSVGLFSDKIFDKTTENVKYYQFSKLGYKWNDNFSTSIGFLYVSNFGNALTVPLLTLTYSTNKFVFRAELPAELEIEFLATSKLRIIANGALPAKSYFDKEFENSIRFTENKVGLGLKYNAFKYTWVYVAITKMMNNEFSWQNPKIAIGKLENDYRLSAGIYLHID